MAKTVKSKHLIRPRYPLRWRWSTLLWKPGPGARALRFLRGRDLVCGFPEGEEPGRNPVALLSAVVLELKVDLLLTDQIELAAVGKGLELGVLIFQIPDTSAEFFNFAGITEINDQTDGFLFH